MSVIKAIKQRRAIRNYEARPVEKEKIEQLLEVATYAPTDRLREPWHFYVFGKEKKKDYEALATAYLQERFPTKPNLVESSLKVVLTTPTVIVVTAKAVENDEAATMDDICATSCAIQNMWLAAEELGLGFVWRTRGVGLVHDERLHSFIGAQKDECIIGTIFIGYPEAAVPSATKRTLFSEKTTWL
ncbi:nitroreductase family protein [Kurthia massiliensis]|uniref:nitroreductase family protein n=1 Tax=Kurthia massiliensis TaxID=1033739 RepID=UPI0002883BFF|nr:nitroreductase [Kurthia massiliensis]